MQPTESVPRKIARTIFGEIFRDFNQADLLEVEERPNRILLTYVPSRMSADRQDAMRVELSFHFGGQEMWIGWVCVAAPLRSRGFGSQLVQVAETIARELGVKSICVFPLIPANSFWEKMGYVPHHSRARVLCKELCADHQRTREQPVASGQRAG